MNTLQTIVACTLGIALATSATAQVMSSPSYSRQECWVEEVPVYAAPQARSNMGAMIGGTAGGIIGNQVGGGHGRAAATVIGAVLGAVTGERLDNPQQVPQYATQRVQRCRYVN